jgi:hypothetical protein
MHTLIFWFVIVPVIAAIIFRMLLGAMMFVGRIADWFIALWQPTKASPEQEPYGYWN